MPVGVVQIQADGAINEKGGDMAVQRHLEKWAHSVNKVTIGATKEEGGTRSKSIVIGGQNTPPVHEPPA